MYFRLFATGNAANVVIQIISAIFLILAILILIFVKIDVLCQTESENTEKSNLGDVFLDANSTVSDEDENFTGK